MNPGKSVAVRPTPKIMRTQPDHRNRRTAFILLSVVLVFFVGIIMRRWVFGS